MDWIKELLKGFVPDDKIDEVIESYKKEFPKHAVPKAEFNKVNGELKDTKKAYDDLSASVEDMAAKDGTIEDLKAQLTAKGEEIEQFKSESEQRVQRMEKKGALERLLRTAGMNEAALDLVTDTADLDSYQLDKKGNLVDGEDIVTGYKESRASLFTVTTPAPGGGEPPEPGKNPPKPGKDEKDMSTAEYYEKIGMKPFNRR